MHSVHDFLRVAAANGWQVTAPDRRGALLPRVFGLRANRLRPQPRRLWVPPHTSGDDAPTEWTDGAEQ